MEPICFLCQEYEVDIGHQTILCPKQFCKKCHQAGHFAMNCKTFCKDFVTKDEQLVKLENKDEIKTEIHSNDHSCKIETKTENYITVRKDLVKTENKDCGEFSKSEEDSLMYCLESMPPAGTKKRKIDSESLIEKDLPLEEVEQKIIEKLSNDLVNLTCLESMPPKDTKKRKIDSELSVEKDLSLEELQQKVIEKLNILNELHQSEIKDLRQRLSKNALIIKKQSKELKTLSEDKSMPPKDTKKRKIDSELSDEKDLSLEEIQQKVIEKLNILNELHQSEIKDLRLRLSKNALIIGKQGKELKTFSEEKIRFEIELNDMYQSTSTKSSEVKSSQLKLRYLSCALKKYQSRVLEQSKELKSLRENKEKMAFQLNDKWQEQEREKLPLQELFAMETFKLNNIIGKLKKEIHTLWESKEKMELEWNNEVVGKKSEIELLQTQFAQKIFKLNDTIGKQRKHIDTLLEKLK